MFADPTLKPTVLMTAAVDGLVDHDPNLGVLLVWDGADKEVLVGVFDSADEETINRAITGPNVQALGMASVVRWSPTPTGESSDAWCVIVVHPDAPARFMVRRLVEDHTWWSLPPAGAPWFALSTASGLRAAITNKQPMVFKRATDERLYRRVDEATPDVDEQGRL